MAAEDDLDLLAGEYVLGALAPDERAAAERRLLDNPDLAARVAAWQDAAGASGRGSGAGGAATPGLAANSALAERQHAAQARVPWWRRLGLWRGWAGIATAAALGLLAMVVTTPQPAPGLVAVLTAADGRPVWLVSAAADEAALGARQLADSLQPGRVPELWLLPAGATRPVSLGLLDPAGANRAASRACPRMRSAWAPCWRSAWNRRADRPPDCRPGRWSRRGSWSRHRPERQAQAPADDEPPDCRRRRGRPYPAKCCPAPSGALSVTA